MALPRRSAASGSSVSTGYADVSEMDKYKLISNIGKGSFGVISKVQRVTDGKEFALKQLDYSKMTDKDRKQILAEVAILESLKHRNIVQLIQKIKDPKNERIYIVMEYCTSGDLGSLIRKSQRSGLPLHEDKIWNIFLQITLALHHCHWPAERPSKNTSRPSSSAAQASTSDGGIARYQVLHRDLKPENVFLSDEFVKLGDFGLSKDMGTASFTSTYVGTPLYMPPEILAENRYDTKSDIWSLGCLVFEMCALHSPFSTAQTQAELISMVKSGKLPPLPAHISPALKSVIRAMLTINPVKRPSTKDLLDMDEMKLHRKLFTVQNQTSLLLAKRDELKGYEDQLRSRTTMLDEREKALTAREASITAREALCDTKEEESKETQRRLNQAAESLRAQWERFREEKERYAGDAEEPRGTKMSNGPLTRPPLEERNTLPLAAMSRLSRAAAYGDTPSKIPLAAISSPAPLDARLNAIPNPRAQTPLRRGNTKSLGNLAAAARADAERDAAWANTASLAEATPAKQTMIGFPRQQRTSIGSPNELMRYNEDISMASPMSVDSPWMPRPRRSSIVPASGLSAVGTGTGHTSATTLQQRLASVSTHSSTISTHPSSGSGSGESSSSTSTSASAAAAAGSSSLPPTMIPAPVSTFIYKEAATPAKWAMEDPDLPSPFLRRAATAPLPPITQQQARQTEYRQVLGSIDPQPSACSASHSLPSSVTGSDKPSLAGVASRPSTTTSASSSAEQGVLVYKKMPRSKSGNLNLHQHVLRNNAVMAGRTSCEGPAAGGRVRGGGVSGTGRESVRMM